MEKYCDCHMHGVGQEENGFLIALDGNCRNEDGYFNEEILNVAKDNGVFPVQYITSDLKQDVYMQIVKYHARKERYSVLEVDEHIKRINPKLVIMDTINEPFWSPYDYWTLAKNNEEVSFLMSHAGGFDIAVFVQMVMFQKNVWMDFSFSQEYFGWKDSKSNIEMVTNWMDLAVRDKRIASKLLFGSDRIRNQACNIEVLLKKYEDSDFCQQILKENFWNLVSQASL